MNIKNLEIMLCELDTIYNDRFNGSLNTFVDHRDIKNITPIYPCGVLGHCIKVDAKNVELNYRNANGDIDFEKWSYDYTGLSNNLETPNGEEDLRWEYMFGNNDLTLSETILRIESVTRGFMPQENFNDRDAIRFDKNNLQRMVEHLKTVDEDKFDMYCYRNNNNLYSTTCNSIGCIIGHCTILDSDNINENFTNNGLILFNKWSYNFTNIESSFVWDFLFSSIWRNNIDNSLKGAIKRLQYVIDGGSIDDVKTTDSINFKEAKKLYS